MTDSDNTPAEETPIEEPHAETVYPEPPQEQPIEEQQAEDQETPQTGSLGEVAGAFGKLGFIAFGGPVAHVAFFREEFVRKRKWLGDTAYADLIAFTQFLPGPASSQLCMILGLLRGGIPGMVIANLLFTIPSAIIMIVAALLMSSQDGIANMGWVHGLKVAVVAIVAWAIWGMAKKLCPDRTRATIGLLAAGGVFILNDLFLGWGWRWLPTQFLIIGGGALLGLLLVSREKVDERANIPLKISKKLALYSALIGIALLVIPMIINALVDWQPSQVFAAFYRTGASVFGGGHVVLPMIEAEVVPHWVDHSRFLAGYGIAQALPGPLFTLSAYLGACMSSGIGGIAYGLLALTGIFLPSFFIVLALLPAWNALRTATWIRSAMAGVTASVVGLLLAAWYSPVFTAAVREQVAASDLALALGCFVMIGIWRFPAWAVVIVAAGVGILLDVSGVPGWGMESSALGVPHP